MGKGHSHTEYVPVKIPRTLADAIDKLVGRFGFTSRAEVVKAATREILQRYVPEELVISKEAVLA